MAVEKLIVGKKYRLMRNVNIANCGKYYDLKQKDPDTDFFIFNFVDSSGICGNYVVYEKNGQQLLVACCCFRARDFDEYDTPTSSISSLSPLMSVVQKARDLFLSAEERAYRKAGFKDDCGHWTADARQVFLEQLMGKSAKEILFPLAEKINDEAENASVKK